MKEWTEKAEMLQRCVSQVSIRRWCPLHHRVLVVSVSPSSVSSAAGQAGAGSAVQL